MSSQNDKRKQQYQNIMSDPDKKTLYRSKAKERQNKYLEKFKDGSDLIREKNLLIRLLRDEASIEKIEDLKSKILLIDLELKKHQHLLTRQNKNKETAKNLRELKNSNGLEGLLLRLREQIATQKNEIKKTIMIKLLKTKDIAFKLEIDNLSSAKKSNDSSKIVQATKALNRSMNDFAAQQNEVKVYVDHSKKFADFISLVKDINMQEKDTLIEYGKELCHKYSEVKFFQPLVSTTSQIIQILQGHLNE